MQPATRRDFAKISGAALGLPSPAPPAAPAAAGKDYYAFPADFVWGTAAASYQVEGAAAEDGRKPSTWDTYSKTPGKVELDHNGDVACDHYHRYPGDIALMKSLGVKAYRFSIAWPRVVPDGTGQPNPKGLDFYSRLVDALLAAGIRPFATLFHWDLPQACEDRFGGWQSKDCAKAFADYCGLVAKRLGDRVGHFFTINEFSCYTDEGYHSGTKAPGKRLPLAKLYQVRHNAVLGHGLGLEAVRASAPVAVKVGIAENPAICVPVIETPEHIAAAGRAMRELNAQFLTAVLEGRYTDAYLRTAGPDAPVTTPAEMKAISGRLDFVGLNMYTPTYVRADSSAPLGFTVVPPPASYPRMLSSWLTIGPQIAYWGPRHMREIWKVNDVYITENGCSATDRPAEDGEVWDTDRVMYVRNHLVQAHRAVSEGWPLRGYFWWSLMDNFEWVDGYTRRFGIYYVNFETQKRTPKLSAKFYREVIARNAVA